MVLDVKTPLNIYPLECIRLMVDILFDDIYAYSSRQSFRRTILKGVLVSSTFDTDIRTSTVSLSMMM